MKNGKITYFFPGKRFLRKKKTEKLCLDSYFFRDWGEISIGLIYVRRVDRLFVRTLFKHVSGMFFSSIWCHSRHMGSRSLFRILPSVSRMRESLFIKKKTSPDSTSPPSPLTPQRLFESSKLGGPLSPADQLLLPPLSPRRSRTWGESNGEPRRKRDTKVIHYCIIYHIP